MVAELGSCRLHRRVRPQLVGQLAAGVCLSLLASGMVQAQSSSDGSGWRAQWRRQWQAAHPAESSKQNGSQNTAHSGSDKNAPQQNATGNSSAAKPSAAVSMPSHAASAVGSSADTGLSAATIAASSQHAAPVTPAPTAPAPAPASHAAASLTPTPAVQNQQAQRPSPAPAAAPVSSPAVSAAAANTARPDILAQTKPDVWTPADVNNLPPGSLKASDHTQNNAFAPVGDAWKMLAYLLPMLLVIVGCLHLLKRFQMKTGRLGGGLGSAPGMGSRWNATPAAPQPKGGLVSALLNGLGANKARNTTASSIRLIESAPVGNANVHLLEVRGRILLLGGTPMGLSLLAEFDEQRGADGGFRDMLSQAANDMDALDYEQSDMPATATVSALEDLMRETNQAVSRRSRRYYAAQEEGKDE